MIQSRDTLIVLSSRCLISEKFFLQAQLNIKLQAAVKKKTFCEIIFDLQRVAKIVESFWFLESQNCNCSSKNISPYKPEVRSKTGNISRKTEGRGMVYHNEDLRKHERIGCLVK